MSTQTLVCDIFLSFPPTEGEAADVVARALRKAGFGVVTASEFKAGKNVQESLRKGLVRSGAFVAVIDPHRPITSSLGVELGAAMAWNKPVYAVYPDHATTKRPSIPSDYSDVHAFPISRIDDVVQSIQDGLSPLSDDEKSVLCEVYQKMNTPVDRILVTPLLVEQLAKKFNKRCDRMVAGERLVQALLNLRKAGELPRSKRTRRVK